MKRILCALFVAMMLFNISSCGGGKEEHEFSDPPSLTDIAMIIEMRDPNADIPTFDIEKWPSKPSENFIKLFVQQYKGEKVRFTNFKFDKKVEDGKWLSKKGKIAFADYDEESIDFFNDLNGMKTKPATITGTIADNTNNGEYLLVIALTEFRMMDGSATLERTPSTIDVESSPYDNTHLDLNEYGTNKVRFTSQLYVNQRIEIDGYISAIGNKYAIVRSTDGMTSAECYYPSEGAAASNIFEFNENDFVHVYGFWYGEDYNFTMTGCYFATTPEFSNDGHGLFSNSGYSSDWSDYNWNYDVNDQYYLDSDRLEDEPIPDDLGYFLGEYHMAHNYTMQMDLWSEEYDYNGVSWKQWEGSVPAEICFSFSDNGIFIGSGMAYWYPPGSIRPEFEAYFDNFDVEFTMYYDGYNFIVNCPELELYDASFFPD